MRLKVNGETKEYESELTLLEMMKKLGISDKVMAAAVNMNIVKQESWKTYLLKDEDKVELLDFVGGG
ncbi:MAG: sulfur carrier protein ThiS [Campylobacterales bacterium]|nr:sulfur carrier protein ThiS [Campylobacterales bacterium]